MDTLRDIVYAAMLLDRADLLLGPGRAMMETNVKLIPHFLDLLYFFQLL